MKIVLTFKTPDVLDQLRDKIDKSDLDEQENKLEEIKDILSKWIRHSEYVDIEFDLDKPKVNVLSQF